MKNKMVSSDYESTEDKLMSNALKMGMNLTFLKEQMVPPGQLAGGDIQVEMSKLESKSTLTFEIRIGNETHTLRFNIRK